MENGKGRPATDAQLEYLSGLAESRAMEDADRAFLLEHMKNFDTKLASKWIEALKVLPPKPKPQPVQRGVMAVPDSIPDGRYALLRQSDKVWVFYRIKTKEQGIAYGVGATVRVVNRLHGAPGAFRYTKVLRSEWNWVVSTVVKDPGLHSTLFGLKVGACGVCGSPLTDPVSIAMGIGPICARKVGFGDVDE